MRHPPPMPGLRARRPQSKVGNKWSEVAKHIPGRTGQQCAQRWRHKVRPRRHQPPCTGRPGTQGRPAHRRCGKRAPPRVKPTMPAPWPPCAPRSTPIFGATSGPTRRTHSWLTWSKRSASANGPRSRATCWGAQTSSAWAAGAATWTPPSGGCAARDRSWGHAGALASPT